MHRGFGGSTQATGIGSCTRVSPPILRCAVQRGHGGHDMDLVQHPRRAARAQRNAPRTQARRRTAIRGTRTCAGRKRARVAESPDSAEETAGRRMSFESADSTADRGIRLHAAAPSELYRCGSDFRNPSRALTRWNQPVTLRPAGAMLASVNWKTLDANDRSAIVGRRPARNGVPPARPSSRIDQSSGSLDNPRSIAARSPVGARKTRERWPRAARPGRNGQAANGRRGADGRAERRRGHHAGRDPRRRPFRA
jgi:hypothetical protein